MDPCGLQPEDRVLLCPGPGHRPRKDAAILANCPDREVRRRWMRRILDHDGTTNGEGGIEAWLRLGEAVGLTREEVRDERRVAPGVRFAVDAYVTFARTRPWVEAVRLR
jgi:pyrroloquinoline-quinone synthase